MERRDLEVFLTLAEELHSSRTAERLHVSQALVSQTAKRLERHIGAPLFDRTSRRVALTPIGRGLRDDLAPAYRRIAEGVARARESARGTALLRVGFEAPAPADLVAPVLDVFRARHPGSAVRVREAAFRDPFALLRDGEIHVLVTLFPVVEPDLASGPVPHEEPLVLAVADGHPFTGQREVTRDDLARDTVFKAAYWRDATPAGLPVARGRDHATFQEPLTAVADGEGVCPLGEHAVGYFTRPRIAFLPIRDVPRLRWGAVWPESGETGVVREFAAAAR
ncbi:LysR family transcriptional regulator [Saccharothrix longispora]|uniref:LysR family transcriptional regulator n=1 Tax=Saccharothrix longispora TaxID=33920 RepID=UPI0028FDAA85|nr:LysR family transcriptional regulator [Saccharothrix longispora]MBY8847800.1 LysR family transcriptional regulator [Saccharothrix sp. MB29]MDU0288698.1 LysR family transcriptional regulator [Saccharothrix longispora]